MSRARQRAPALAQHAGDDGHADQHDHDGAERDERRTRQHSETTDARGESHECARFLRLVRARIEAFSFGGECHECLAIDIPSAINTTIAAQPSTIPIRYRCGSSENAREIAALFWAAVSDGSIRANKNIATGASRRFVPTMSLVAPSTTPVTEMSL